MFTRTAQGTKFKSIFAVKVFSLNRVDFIYKTEKSCSSHYGTIHQIGTASLSLSFFDM